MHITCIANLRVIKSHSNAVAVVFSLLEEMGCLFYLAQVILVSSIYRSDWRFQSMTGIGTPDKVSIF